MKTTIIELLNKIANGEAPKEIKVHNKIYKWKENLSLYICGGGQLCFDYFVENNKLNDKVEIIEEDKKIEKIKSLNEKIKSLNNVGSCRDLIGFRDKQQLNNHILKDKINEIIDEINNLKEGK